MAKICPSCFMENEDHLRYCAFCGDDLQEKPRTRRFKPILITAAGIALILAIAAGAWFLLRSGKSSDTPPPPSVEPEIYPTADKPAPDDPESTASPLTGAPAADPTLPDGTDYFSIAVGDTLTYGIWEQDANYGNGGEAIEWIVLEKRSDKMLVISKYALENIQFNSHDNNVVWENSDLRAWLNNYFYQEAFTWDEQQHILLATVPAHGNPYYSHAPIYDTEDYVFVLSPMEAERYFYGNDARICYATKHTAQGPSVWLGPGNSVWWWLRTPGEYYDDATCVNSDGTVDYSQAAVVSLTGTVRPAMWITASPAP